MANRASLRRQAVRALLQAVTALLLAVAALQFAGCGGGGIAEPGPQATADTTPPRITDISGISEGDVIETSVVFGASAVDDTGVANFKLRIDGNTVVDAALASIVYSWDVRDAKEGPCLLSFVASDAAGNSTVQLVNVTVGDPADHPAPAEPSPVPLEVATQPVYDDDFALPPMSDALYNPNDRENPRLIISGIQNEDTVYRIRKISVFASDDTGVNVITLLIDGQQLALENKSSIQYTWDTNYYEDGFHVLSIIVRDNGGTVYRCNLQVTVDNSTDFFGPEFDPLSESSWSVDGLSGPLADVREIWHGWSCKASGRLDLVIKASDKHEIVKFEMSMNGELVESSVDNRIEYTWETQEEDRNSWLGIDLLAEDSLGYTTEGRLNIWVADFCEVCGEVKAANGVEIKYGEVTVLPGHITSLDDVVLATAVDTTQISPYGFRTNNVPAGRYTLHIKCGEYQMVAPVDFVIDDYIYLRDENSLVMPTSFQDTVPNTRAAVVTGTEDDIPAVIKMLQETNLGYHIRGGEHYYYDFPEVVARIDGDNSLNAGEHEFLDFIVDRSLMYQYCYIIIEGGNAYEQEWKAHPLAANRLRQWVSDGGQLVVTGTSYDFVEQVFPRYVDFTGDDLTDGLSAMPEALGAAEAGLMITTAYVSFMTSDEDPQWYWNDYYLSRNGVSGTDFLWPTTGWTTAENFASAVKECVFAQLDADDPSASVPIAFNFNYNLGRVTVLCFPVSQPEPEKTEASGLTMDFLVFAR